MHVNIIGVPLTYGCGKVGADQGPNALRMEDISSLAEDSDLRVYDLGDVYVPNLAPGDKYKSHDHLKYLDHIVEVNNNLAEKVNVSMKAGNFPLIIGGDHALAIGSVAGVSAYYENIDDYAIIWIDAHSDINTPDSSPSGNIHGMPLAASMNEGHESLTNVYFEGMKVKPENVYIIGARDIDSGEYELAKQVGLHLYEMKDVRKNGLEKTIEEVINKINESGIKNVHLSFDIDVLDASLVPGTGTPVKNGFTIDEGKYTLSTILKENFVRSMDFVELNPTLDQSDKTVENCMDILKTIFENIDLNKINS